MVVGISLTFLRYWIMRQDRRREVRAEQLKWPKFGG
jgi:hypothetical protein